MSTALVTASPDETIDGAEIDMKLADIRHVLVVDSRRHLVGVVSNRDVLAAIGEGGEMTVRAVMTAEVETVTADSLAADAVNILLERKFGCLPVVGDEGQLVGVITESDFLRIAHRALTGNNE